MNPQTAFVRKILYLSSIAVLLVPLFWLSHPATADVKEQKGRPGGKLAQLRDVYGISQTQLGEVNLTSETIKLTTLGMRGIAAEILWNKANDCQKKKDWTNLSAALEQITKVEPNFIGTWRFQAWNLSYNVAAAFDDYHDKYFWVIRGVRFLQDGVRYNDREPRLLWDIGWFISNKIGRADEKKLYRRLFKEDVDFNGARPQDLCDNWLVGEEWFRKAERLVDTTGERCKGVAPLIFYSDAPMCHMSYSSALEEDGVFGEKARLAWKKAGQEWRQYGDRDILSYENHEVVLNEQEKHEADAHKLLAQLDALSPGLREDAQRETRPPQTRRTQGPGHPHRKANPQAIRPRRGGGREAPGHSQGSRHAAGGIQTHAGHDPGAKDRRSRTEDQQRPGRPGDRQFRLLAASHQVEQTDAALSARKSIHQGDQAYAKADLGAARTDYELGLAGWRNVLDDFPSLKEDVTTQDDMGDIFKRYKHILNQLDVPFPKNFILEDVKAAWEAKRGKLP